MDWLDSMIGMFSIKAFYPFLVLRRLETFPMDVVGILGPWWEWSFLLGKQLMRRYWLRISWKGEVCLLGIGVVYVWMERRICWSHLLTLCTNKFFVAVDLFLVWDSLGDWIFKSLILLSWHKSFVGKKWKRTWTTVPFCLFGLFIRRKSL